MAQAGLLLRRSRREVGVPTPLPASVCRWRPTQEAGGQAQRFTPGSGSPVRGSGQQGKQQAGGGPGGGGLGSLGYHQPLRDRGVSGLGASLEPQAHGVVEIKVLGHCQLHTTIEAPPAWLQKDHVLVDTGLAAGCVG